MRLYRTDQRCKLPDGRWLGFEDLGPLDGTPLFFIPGAARSRHDWYLLDSARLIEKFNLRVISFDRPGLGLSTFRPRRTIRHFISDISFVANVLQIEQFALLGYSGGGPYALAFTEEFPSRLTACGVVSGMGPFDPDLIIELEAQTRQAFQIARQQPFRSRLHHRRIKSMARSAPEKFMAQYMATLPEVDQAILQDLHQEEHTLKTYIEALRNGPRGAQHDLALLARPWNIPLGQITMKVHLWHGGQDRAAPPAIGHYLESVIPDVEMHFYPQEGHLSLLVNHADEIIATLLETE
jgi:pimeloyl-ACP methyl ester carboxylesterase